MKTKKKWIRHQTKTKTTTPSKNILATVNKNWNIECAFFWFKVQARAYLFGFQAK